VTDVTDVIEAPAPAPARTRRRIGPWIAGAVLVVLAGFVAVLATGGDDRQVRSTLIGLPAPGIAGETIDGTAYDLAEHRGQYVVVNFFATWCVPCIREHPQLVEFEERHRAEEDASVVSVVFDSRPQQVRDFFAEQGGEWPVVLDPDGRTALQYGVAGVPESYLVAPDGTVLIKIEGGVTADDLDRLLRQVQGDDVDGDHLSEEGEAS
jgi:cytochrome c biogenesis protein CcmG/thiol:disulfide interchange protein DsbE